MSGIVGFDDLDAAKEYLSESKKASPHLGQRPFYRGKSLTWLEELS